MNHRNSSRLDNYADLLRRQASTRQLRTEQLLLCEKSGPRWEGVMMGELEGVVFLPWMPLGEAYGKPAKSPHYTSYCVPYVRHPLQVRPIPGSYDLSHTRYPWKYGRNLGGALAPIRPISPYFPSATDHPLCCGWAPMRAENRANVPHKEINVISQTDR